MDGPVNALDFASPVPELYEPHVWRRPFCGGQEPLPTHDVTSVSATRGGGMKEGVRCTPVPPSVLLLLTDSSLVEMQPQKRHNVPRIMMYPSDTTFECKSYMSMAVRAAHGLAGDLRPVLKSVALNHGKPVITEAYSRYGGRRVGRDEVSRVRRARRTWLE